jgi:hypothetical protein
VHDKQNVKAFFNFFFFFYSRSFLPTRQHVSRF